MATKDPIYQGENIVLANINNRDSLTLLSKPKRLEINFKGESPTAVIVEYNDEGEVQKSQPVKVNYIGLELKTGSNAAGEPIEENAAKYKISGICNITIADTYVMGIGRDRRTPQGLGSRKISVTVAPKNNLSKRYAFEELMNMKDLPSAPLVDEVVTKKYTGVCSIDAKGHFVEVKDSKEVEAIIERTTPQRATFKRVSQQGLGGSGRGPRGR